MKRTGGMLIDVDAANWKITSRRQGSNWRCRACPPDVLYLKIKTTFHGPVFDIFIRVVVQGGVHDTAVMPLVYHIELDPAFLIVHHEPVPQNFIGLGNIHGFSFVCRLEAEGNRLPRPDVLVMSCIFYIVIVCPAIVNTGIP